MEIYRITGGNRLEGEIDVQGAKNSALPVLAASVMTDSCSLIENCPDLSDTRHALQILTGLGCRVKVGRDGVMLDPAGLCRSRIPPALCRTMRSSVTFLGPLLARFGKAELACPGGCRLGERPIDLHLEGLTRMGAEIRCEGDRLFCLAPQGLSGGRIRLSFPSVGATENLMMAACLAKGETEIIGCAKEPEIVDLAEYLTRCGADICGAGQSVIRICGVKTLGGCRYRIPGDRIAAMTYLIAAAVTGGDITVRGVDPLRLQASLSRLTMTGKQIRQGKDFCRLYGSCPPKTIPWIGTGPYPDFPTDDLPLFLSLTAMSEGTGVLVENIFGNRYSSADGLSSMGAHIHREGKVAVVRGRPLHGSVLAAGDLRAGAGLVLAALAAEGCSVVKGIHWIERGYEHLKGNLSRLGADIREE